MVRQSYSLVAEKDTHMILYCTEVTKLSNLWDHHRRDCKHEGGVKIELASGGGIGTRTIVTCGCGKELDITDYLNW